MRNCASRYGDRAPLTKTALENGPATPNDVALMMARITPRVLACIALRFPAIVQTLRLRLRPPPEVLRAFRDPVDLVVLFHVVASGTCWVAIAGGDKHWASSGDVIVLPYGDQHQMGGLEDRCSNTAKEGRRPTWSAATCTAKIPCSIQRFGHCRRSSWCTRPARPPSGCRPTSPTHSSRPRCRRPLLVECTPGCRSCC